MTIPIIAAWNTPKFPHPFPQFQDVSKADKEKIVQAIEKLEA